MFSFYSNSEHRLLKQNTLPKSKGSLDNSGARKKILFAGLKFKDGQNQMLKLYFKISKNLKPTNFHKFFVQNSLFINKY